MSGVTVGVGLSYSGSHPLFLMEARQIKSSTEFWKPATLYSSARVKHQARLTQPLTILVRA